MTEEDIRDFNL